MKVMVGKLRLIHIIIFYCLCYLFISCDLHPDIKITREYIYNSNWGKDGNASISICKMIPQESKYFEIDSLSGFEILNGSKIYDSTFFYSIAAHKNHKIKKLYFTKKNQDIEWYVNMDLSKKVDSIGRLQLNTWYLIGGVYKTWTYYIYVDKEGTVHTWAINPVNI